MSLRQALDDCLIDFDRRVLVTDLLEEYKLTYKEVHELLEAHIKQQEDASANNKYEKRFLVYGNQTDGGELYTIVQGEDKLKEWIAKLQNSQSQLYSVEIAGGSKSAAPIFKPMQQVEVQLAKLEKRAGATTPKGVSNGIHKPSETTKPTNVKTETSEPSSSKVDAPTEQPKKTSPSEQKGKAAVAKKGSIGSFFSAAPAAKAKETKAAVAAKPASSSSMDNFFKKQPTSSGGNQAKPTPTNNMKKDEPSASKSSNNNTSIQLFDEASSDEEEKLDKLRRKVVGSGDESDETANALPTSSSKRRRIVDSDDDEQPQKKSAEPQEEKLEGDVEMEADTNETFLDDDGFVITVRAKKAMQPSKKKASPTAGATAAAKAAAAAATTKKKSPPAASKSAKETPKIKQGSITSFFAKK
ncbi:DNA polymerase delta subunit 3 [Drosophila grimshawi]|uniref:GH11048 n=1 Tax=Drosophila grimshawi TaxID=7222 RepID=B4JC72_DROGR|nr:DNA polymerase delta subunit 3 [Drosophila grimshawi]EDW03085.1 GH11048 [Drosophila grimshawi]